MSLAIATAYGAPDKSRETPTRLRKKRRLLSLREPCRRTAAKLFVSRARFMHAAGCGVIDSRKRKGKEPWGGRMSSHKAMRGKEGSTDRGERETQAEIEL